MTFREANAIDNPFPDRTFDVIIGQEAWCHIPDKGRLVSECVRVLRQGGHMSFTDILAGTRLSDADRHTMQDGMGYVDLGTLESYCRLLEEAGCEVLETEDLGPRWAVILRERLEMYRGLKEPTVAKFGEEIFDRWDRLYALFVELVEKGDLGGGRFLARRK